MLVGLACGRTNWLFFYQRYHTYGQTLRSHAYIWMYQFMVENLRKEWPNRENLGSDWWNNACYDQSIVNHPWVYHFSIRFIMLFGWDLFDCVTGGRLLINTNRWESYLCCWPRVLYWCFFDKVWILLTQYEASRWLHVCLKNALCVYPYMYHFLYAYRDKVNCRNYRY